MPANFSDNHRAELRFLAGSLLVLALLAAAVTHVALVSALDTRGIHEMHEAWSPQLTSIVFAVTAIGGTQVIVPVAALAAAGLAALRRRHEALSVVLSITATEVLVAAFKSAVGRPRPPAEAALAHAADFSFPSGHTAAVTAVFAPLVWLASRHLRGPARLAGVAAGVALITGVGLSRVYIGVHYPTDVVAGWLVGAAIAAAAWLAVCLLGRALGRPLAPKRGDVAPALAHGRSQPLR